MTADPRIQVLLVEDNPTDKMLVEDELAHTSGTQFSVAHVEQLNDALTRLGAERDRAVLFGSSLGGLTACRVAEDDARVCARVLLAPAFRASSALRSFVHTR